jgi:hypothetical protein
MVNSYTSFTLNVVKSRVTRNIVNNCVNIAYSVISLWLKYEFYDLICTTFSEFQFN